MRLSGSRWCTSPPSRLVPQIRQPITLPSGSTSLTGVYRFDYSVDLCPPDGRRITHHETKFYWTKIQLAAQHSDCAEAFVCRTGNFLGDLSHITVWRVLLAARDRNGDLVVVIAIGLALVLLYCLEQVFHRTLNQTPRTVRLNTQSLSNLLKTEPVLPDHQKSHLRPWR